MSTKLTPADEAFQSLMHGGAVTGLCVCAGPTVVRSRMPFSTHRIENAARLVDEAFQHQGKKRRSIDRIWFGLGTFNLLAVSYEGMRLIILHVRDEETDFLAQVGMLFLKDHGKSLVELPEHKRLVTQRILISAPLANAKTDDVPLPAKSATSRIPISSRYKKIRDEGGGDGSSSPPTPVVPKAIKRPSSDGDHDDGEQAPPNPSHARPKHDSEPPRPLGIWIEYRERLSQILNKAVGEELAQSIIDEQTEAFAGNPCDDLPKSWFKEFGDTVVGKIPDEALRSRAKIELVAAFREMSL